MEYYFADRKSNILGVGSTDGKGEWRIDNDIETQSVDNRPAVELSLDIHFTTDQEQAVNEMAKATNFILYQDEEGNGHQMVIESVEHNSLGHIHSIVASDAGNDLINETVGAFKADKPYTIAEYITRFTNDSGWDIGINEFPDNVRTLEWTSEESSLARIIAVAKDFDAVLSFGFEFVGTNLVKHVINIRHETAGDSLISFEMNKDINNIVAHLDTYDMETSIKAYGAVPESTDGSTNQDPINLIGYHWTDPTGQFVLDQYGFLHDTIAVQKYSRLLSNSNPNPTQSDWNRVKTFDSKSQAALLQAALADLKKYNHPNETYDIDLVNSPYVPLNQTVHIADENQQLFLSAKVLSIQRSRANHSVKLTLGEFAHETVSFDERLSELANQMANMPKTIQYYPWLRYADDDKGTNMSAFPTGKKYMAIVWSNKTSVPSDNPEDYAGKWALIQGKDGADGVPGAKGADGRTSYFHTAWADDVSGKSGFTVSGGDGKKYIGTYSDFTKADSTNPADYNWALFKGKDGDVGPKGPQGLPGKSGADGRTTYAHFAYANSQDGHADFSTTDSNRKYIGFYSDFTSDDSTNPSDYSWSLIKGADGANGKDGVPGKAGADGKTSYFHIAYADSSDGRTNFSLDTPGSRKYIGSYTDFTKADSNNPADYSWQLVQGPQGPQGDSGADGLPGKDGVGLATTTVTYQASTSGTTVPSGTWSTSVPSVSKGQYLWTRTVWMYTDKSSEAGYSVAYIAKDGNSGKDGIAGKDGVGIKSTVIEYAVSSSGITKPSTGWSTTIPSIAPGQFMWTRTTWAYTDGTNEVGYSVAQAGKNGERGKQIFKSSYEDGPQSSGYFWSDLSPAPSVDNPPKIGDTVITPSGNIFQIDTVIVGGGGGGGTFGVGNLLGNIRGPQGPQGVPGSKDVPYTYIQLGTPASPKKGDLWWHGTTLNDATALQYYDGSTWIDQSIQQAILNIEKLVAIEIDSATINSPDINAPFHHTALSDANKGKFSSGITGMQYGHVTIMGNVENDQGKADGHMLISDLGPSGFISRERTPDNAGDVQYANLQGGKLNLSTLISDENAATKKYVFSTYKSTDNVTYYWSNTKAYSNIDFSSGYIYYSRRGNLVTVNFDLYAIANQYQYLRLAEIRPGYQPYLKNKIICACPSFSYAGESATMYSSTPSDGTVGWYGIISRGQGAYAGSVTYLTQDDYPTDDLYFD